MTSARRPQAGGASVEPQVDALVRLSQVLMAVVAHSLAEVGSTITLPQLRVLVMVHSRGPLNLTAVAEGLGVHPSNATRTCDRLVAARLLDRRESAADRRRVALTLTADGEALVASVMRYRRDAIERVLLDMPREQRRRLTQPVDAFCRAAGELTDGEGHMLRWISPG